MEFKVGDKVKFKTWEEMEHEYGLVYSNTAINCNFHFTNEMDELIDRNRIYTIKTIAIRGTVEFEEDDLPDQYLYSLDMIKPANEEDVKETYPLNKWVFDYDPHLLTVDFEVYGMAEFANYIYTIFLGKKVFFTAETLMNNPQILMNYLEKRRNGQDITIGAFFVGDSEYANATDAVYEIADKMKIYISEDCYILFIMKNRTDYSFDEKDFLMELTEYLFDAFPTEDEALLKIRQCMLDGNAEEGCKLRKEYLKAIEYQERIEKMQHECEKIEEVMYSQREVGLENIVKSIQDNLDEIKLRYTRLLEDLNAAKKELICYKYNKEMKSNEYNDFMNLLQQDIKDNRLISLDILRGMQTSIRMTLVVPLLYFEEDDWNIVGKGVVQEAHASEYSYVINAIFSRKCTIMIEQTVDMKLDRDTVSSSRTARRLEYGIPNSHIDTYNCWDSNGIEIEKYMSDGEYDLAYTQIKSAISGINVTDNPVIVDFCKKIRDYGEMECIIDSETGVVMSIEEANEYYKAKEEEDKK